jgi:hypothetical protein
MPGTGTGRADDPRGSLDGLVTTQRAAVEKFVRALVAVIQAIEDVQQLEATRSATCKVTSCPRSAGRICTSSPMPHWRTRQTPFGGTTVKRSRNDDPDQQEDLDLARTAPGNRGSGCESPSRTNRARETSGGLSINAREAADPG